MALNKTELVQQIADLSSELVQAKRVNEDHQLINGELQTETKSLRRFVAAMIKQIPIDIKAGYMEGITDGYHEEKTNPERREYLREQSKSKAKLNHE